MVVSQKLHTKHLGCCFIAAKSLQALGNDSATLELLEDPDTERLVSDQTLYVQENPEDLKTRTLVSSIKLLKGQILENIENRELAAESFKQALRTDVYCYEAFQALVEHQMLTADEEKALLKTLKSPDKTDISLVKGLYSLNLKKYECPETPHFPSDLKPFEKNSDVRISLAERLYYNCDHLSAFTITSQIMREDPLHHRCIPLHVALLVDLRKTNALFSLAHSLVDMYPEWSIAWYAVGCYYFAVGKQDSARKYLSKATQLDRLFGPAWLAYGHSFAKENEHDQAMAAYFKALQLMQGCHLPLLYIGLEYSLTNNQNLAEKFFNQALAIAPRDPFVLHELGVTAFTNQEYELAEKYFTDALSRVSAVKDTGGGVSTGLSDKWESLLNNLGHTYRKLERYEDALSVHKQALVISPLNPSTYSAIGYVHSLTNDLTAAVEFFHRALGLRRDDTFSTNMLNEVVERLMSEVDPFPDYPQQIPRFDSLHGEAIGSGGSGGGGGGGNDSTDLQNESSVQEQETRSSSELTPTVGILTPLHTDSQQTLADASNISIDCEMEDVSRTPADLEMDQSLRD